MDQFKEEKDALLQEKGKLRRMAETDIERQKEELRQRKEQDDRLRSQANRRLKEKSDDFDKLYREHKELEKEYD